MCSFDQVVVRQPDRCIVLLMEHLPKQHVQNIEITAGGDVKDKDEKKTRVMGIIY